MLAGGGGSLNDTTFLNGLNDTLKRPFLVGFSDAMDTVFLVGALVLIIAFVLSLLLKEIPLRTMSGQQAARAAAEGATPAATPALDPATTATAAVSPEPEGGRHEAGGVSEADGHGRHERGRHEADATVDR